MSSFSSSSSSEPSSLASSSSSEPSSLAPSPSSEPILTFEYDVLLTFFNGLDEDRPRTFLENRLREAGLKTLVSDIVNDYTWKMIESCRIVMVLITPELFKNQTERLVNILSLPKTVLPFFYGVNQNHVSGQLMRFRRESCDDWIFDWDLHRRSDVVCDLLFGFTLSDDFG
ncbi:hypothetical protein K1719_022934 [Acacia pycnantha]|nr:hypothetical protein K1719_022934 [Acacia pycnantha]